jgi:hypothetical protein
MVAAVLQSEDARQLTQPYMPSILKRQPGRAPSPLTIRLQGTGEPSPRRPPASNAERMRLVQFTHLSAEPAALLTQDAICQGASRGGLTENALLPNILVGAAAV